MYKTKGQLFLIVGNSGSGKDSLIKEALKNWPPAKRSIHIPHRYISRPPHETEPFISTKPQDFVKLQKQGRFCLTWHIYELDYGVPSDIIGWLKKGDNVLVNVSRGIIPEARQKFPGVRVILVHVPLKITEERLKSRGRESENDHSFKERLDRAKMMDDFQDADFIIDNSGSLDVGAKILRNYLLSYSKR